MGSGIAQVAASAGFVTILYDLNQDLLDAAKRKLVKDLEVLAGKQKITEEKKRSILELIHFTDQLHECTGDIVIEAVVENAAVKTKLFNQLAGFNSSQTIFASNTSSLSVSALAKEIKEPPRVAGLHFFNPAPVMKLVEVVKGSQTSDEVIKQLVDFTRQLGKQPVVCRDAPGFIVNRVARPFYIESLRLVEEGLASIATVDRLLESRGINLRPYKLKDLIGNHVNNAVSCSVYDQLQQPERLRPSGIQKEKVDKGDLGKKTGKGYYDYHS
jgi:3-hydroxybutyryl-CoA dehydrogenase